MRLPDRVYNRLARLYFAQRRIRMHEDQRRMVAEDQALRAAAYQRSIDHDGGVCGGVTNGCPYFPCVPRVDTLQ